MKMAKKEIEVFSISLIDLISGALGVMSILFFAIIPQISSAGLISDESKSKIETESDEIFTIISLHILHKQMNSISINYHSFKSDYFIDEDRVLHKSTITLDEKKRDIRVEIKDDDVILAGSKIVFHSDNETKIYSFRKDEEKGFIINLNFDIEHN